MTAAEVLAEREKKKNDGLFHHTKTYYSWCRCWACREHNDPSGELDAAGELESIDDIRQLFSSAPKKRSVIQMRKLTLTPLELTTKELLIRLLDQYDGALKVLIEKNQSDTELEVIDSEYEHIVMRITAATDLLELLQDV